MSLFKEIHLGTNLADVWGGVLYAFRYTEEVLEQKRNQIAVLLEESWLQVREEWDGLVSDLRDISVEMKARVLYLMEEISVINDALHYKTLKVSGGELVGFAQITDYILTLFAHIDNENKVDVYNAVDLGVWEIIRDVYMSIKQGYTLTHEQTQEFETMVQTYKNLMHRLDSRFIIIWAIR